MFRLYGAQLGQLKIMAVKKYKNVLLKFSLDSDSCYTLSIYKS